MPDAPWTDDACSLVDAFRRGERSPLEELEASLAAIESSDLNAFAFVDATRARDAARVADVTKPFGGVPAGIKELEPVARMAGDRRLARVPRSDRDARRRPSPRACSTTAAPSGVGLTTASEFGGLNVSVTKLNGVTHNPWQHGRTTGGSSAGSSAAVAGGLVSRRDRR